MMINIFYYHDKDNYKDLRKSKSFNKGSLSNYDS